MPRNNQNPSQTLKHVIFLVLSFFIPLTVFASGDVRHPIYPPKKVSDVSSVENKVSRVMKISDETLYSWNEPYADFSQVGCPNCDKGLQNRSRDLKWSPDRPDEIKCKFCQHVFPSKKYPLDKIEKVVTPAGTIREYPYYLGEDGRHYYMNSNLLFNRRAWLQMEALKLGNAYQASGKKEYALKAGKIIRRFAENYKEMPLHGASDFAKNLPTFYDVKVLPEPENGVRPYPKVFGKETMKTYKAPYPYLATRVGKWWHYEEVPKRLVLAYDLVADALDEESKNIIEDFFRETVNFLRTYPRYLGNLDPHVAACNIIVGRVIGEPEFVHGGIIGLDMVLSHNYFADGVWKEGSPDYGFQVYNWSRKAYEYARGYSDSPGFIGKASGRRYDDFDPIASAPRFKQAEFTLQQMQQPNGDFATVYDTSPHKNRFPFSGKSESLLQWACGHGMLGRGTGKNQIQARLQFMGKVSHYHFDTLSLLLYAKNREMLSDIGYSHTRIRPYGISILAHNTVMVDQSLPERVRPQGGKLLAWSVDNPTVQFISVDASDTYKQTSLYKRSLALVAVNETDSYIVDLFEVKGGKRHEWLLHGDADHDGIIETNLPLSPRSGTLLPKGKEFTMWASEQGTNRADELENSLGLVTDIQAGRSDKAFEATFRIVPDDGKGLRLHMMSQKDTEIMIANLPSVRRAKEKNEKLRDYKMPLLIARREGSPSAFLAVHEPYENTPFIKSVSQKDNALIVETADFTDIHLFQKSEAPYAFDGRYGFLRIKNNKVVSANLVDGTKLSWENLDINLPEADAGKILKVNGKELLLSGKISMKNADRIYLTFPNNMIYAIPVESAVASGNNTAVELKHDPAFELATNGTSGRFTSFPNSEFTGEVTWRLPRSASLRKD